MHFLGLNGLIHTIQMVSIIEVGPYGIGSRSTMDYDQVHHPVLGSMIFILFFIIALG